MDNAKQAEMAFTNDKYLSQMLEGYESNLPQLQEQLANTREQVTSLEGAEKEVMNTIEELKELLGMSDEVTPPLALVED